MATALFVVKATIPRARERAFNRWYDDVHVPDVLKFPGVVSARRYRALSGEDKYRYMAVYELRDERTLRAFVRSTHMVRLRRDYDRRFGRVSARARFSYRQVFP